MYRGVDSVTAEGQNWDTCEMPKYKINLCESVLRASLAEQRVKAALSSLLHGAWLPDCSEGGQKKILLQG